MTHLVLDGLIGLMLGIALHLTGMDRAETVRETLDRRRRGEGKALLWAAGTVAVLTSLLAWLAVIDVDEVPVLPLTGMTLTGGAIFGLSVGLTGFTPETALAGIGGGRFTESLCALAGCGAAAFVLPRAQRMLGGTQAWFLPRTQTIFRFTLDEGFLLPGGFLALGCAGVGLMLLSLCVRRFRPPEPAPAPLPTLPPSVEPQDVQEDTVVVTLPGEEPVVVDTEAAEREEEQEEEEE